MRDVFDEGSVCAVAPMEEVPMRKLTLLGLLAVLASVTAFALPATATTRGSNGLIAFDRADPASSSGDTWIFVSNPDGTRARRLYEGHACCPGWSHDGRRVAITVGLRDGRIGTATQPARGGRSKTLPLQDPTLNVACHVWSRNDARLACEGWDDKHQGRIGVYTISSTRGGLARRLTRNALGGHDLPGAYSPDGRRLVFSRFDENDNGVGLYVINANGSGLRRITPPGTIIQGGNSGDWSPTSNQIVFSRHVGPSVPGSLWIVNADGSRLRELKVAGLDCGGAVGCHEPQWSPDGTRVVFASNSGQRSDIYICNADGSQLVHVTSGGQDDDPAWGSHPLAP